MATPPIGQCSSGAGPSRGALATAGTPSLMEGRGRSDRGGCTLHRDAVQLRGVLLEHAPPRLLAQVGEDIGEVLLRLRVEAGRVGEVRLEEDIAHADLVHHHAGTVILEPEAGVDVVTEVLRRAALERLASVGHISSSWYSAASIT